MSECIGPAPSELTVCGASDEFVHATASPTRIEIVPGVKWYCPPDSTIATDPLAASARFGAASARTASRDEPTVMARLRPVTEGIRPGMRLPLPDSC